MSRTAIERRLADVSSEAKRLRQELAVIDEQHRFGVHQRLSLGEKGRSVDMFVMTATPIPRTLVLTYFGDMDVSKLDEKPAGRQPIKNGAPTTGSDFQTACSRPYSLQE